MVKILPHKILSEINLKPRLRSSCFETFLWCVVEVSESVLKCFIHFYRVRDRFVIYSQNNDLFTKRVPSVTMEKSWTPIDSHCKNFNRLILTCHIWNISKKCSSRIYKQWKSDFNTSWVSSMCDNSELSCWNFIMGVNGVPIFYIVNHCFWVQ